MRTASKVLLFAVLLLRSSVDLLAQETPHLVPGARVRVWAPDLNVYRLVGRVESLTADTLVLENDGGADRAAIPLKMLELLEVNRGRKSRVVKGAAIGCLVGGVVGGLSAVLDPIADETQSTGLSLDFSEVPVATGIVMGAMAGTVAGAIYGAKHPGEQWEELPLERIRVGI